MESEPPLNSAGTSTLKKGVYNSVQNRVDWSPVSKYSGFGVYGYSMNKALVSKTVTGVNAER